jgi:DNA-binding MarR family transcriptional regulator
MDSGATIDAHGTKRHWQFQGSRVTISQVCGLSPLWTIWLCVTETGPETGPETAPETAHWYDEIAMPALLRNARTVYGTAIRAALVDVGCDDMPRNGAFVVGAIARNGSPLSEIITHLGLSKQRAGQLVDDLVSRGYLDRAYDTADRRRTTVTLTDRGRLGAATGRAAVDRMDADLVGRVGADAVKRTRATLGAIARP